MALTFRLFKKVCASEDAEVFSDVHEEEISMYVVQNKECECSSELLRQLVGKTLDAVIKEDARAVGEYIQENYPDLYKETNDANERIKEVWGACEEGRASISNLNGALSRWSDLSLQERNIYLRERGDAEK